MLIRIHHNVNHNKKYYNAGAQYYKQLQAAILFTLDTDIKINTVESVKCFPDKVSLIFVVEDDDAFLLPEQTSRFLNFFINDFRTSKLEIV